MEPGTLRNYYQRELKILREDGAAFAGRYPKAAAYLGLASGSPPDPLVERLLESLAYLTARVRQESEAELPSLAARIMDLMCPSLSAPLPSISVVSFEPDRLALKDLSQGWDIPAGTRLYSQAEGYDQPVRWRTAWPLTLTPARVSAVSQAAMSLKQYGGEGGECALLRLRVEGLNPAGGQTLRLFLRGDRFSTFPLHDWVHSATRRLFVVDDADQPNRDYQSLSLPRNFLRPAGLDPDDLILPGRDQSWAGFRLLQEYFTCPERFLFWELGPWPNLTGLADAEGRVDLVMLMTEPLPGNLQLEPQMFDPAAVPVINLFERLAEPIHLDHRRGSYLIHPDIRRPESTEIHSVLSVTALASGGRSFELPSYFNRDREGGQEAEGLCWQIKRGPSPREDGTVTTLYVQGGEMDEELTLSVRTLCTNRHQAHLRPAGELSAEIEIPARPRLVLPPTPQRDPARGADDRWRLVSNFALAQEALSGPEGLTTLRNILRLYAPPGDAYAQRQIAGILRLETELMFHPLRPSADHPMGGLVRGLSINLELDDDAFLGGSPFIFANVLEVFMGLRSAINHVTQLRLFLDERKGVYHQWPPRCGQRPLL